MKNVRQEIVVACDVISRFLTFLFKIPNKALKQRIVCTIFIPSELYLFLNISDVITLFCIQYHNPLVNNV